MALYVFYGVQVRFGVGIGYNGDYRIPDVKWFRPNGLGLGHFNDGFWLCGLFGSFVSVPVEGFGFTGYLSRHSNRARHSY